MIEVVFHSAYTSNGSPQNDDVRLPPLTWLIATQIGRNAGAPVRHEVQPRPPLEHKTPSQGPESGIEDHDRLP